MIAQVVSAKGALSVPSEKPKSQLTVVAKAVQDYIAGIPAELAARIEKNKDKLDMAPAMNFVELHQEEYQRGIERLMGEKVSRDGTQFARRIKFDGYSDRIDPSTQITQEECRNLLARMPQSLREMSHLRNVNYDYNGAGYRIHIPKFKADGTFARLSDAVKPEDFPRQKDNLYSVFGYVQKDDGYWYYEESFGVAQENDHPSRLLVGISNGKTIFPSALPHGLASEKSIKSYQLGVFLHEFFHTVDYPNRDPRLREKIILQDQDGMQFNLQEWWEEWEQLLIKEEGPSSISYYAGTYSHLLNRTTQASSSADFDAAVGEQIAETFVAYILNIQANPDGWTDFRAESFGNQEQLKKYTSGVSKSANQKWLLMDRLCRATVISKS